MKTFVLHRCLIATATSAVLLVATFLAQEGIAHGNPATTTPQWLLQPDGTRFQARLWGDEFVHGWETLEGYSILKTPSGYWAYAKRNASGRLSATALIVAKDSPLGAVSTHERPSAAVVSEAMAARSQGPGVYAGPPPSGTVNLPVLLIKFPDKANVKTNADFQSNLFSGGATGPGDLKDYYKEISYNSLTLSSGPGGIPNWVTADNNRSYYNTYDRVRGLVTEAIQKADAAGFNFAPYDNDSNGSVDAVVVVYAGCAPYWCADPPPDPLWPHQSTLTTPVMVDGKQASVYTIQSELLNDTPTTIQTIGVFAHELGHTFGLPDLYDTVSTDGDSEGIGHWGLMGTGSWTSNNPGTENGESPAHMTAWEKWFMGWVSPTLIQGSTNNTSILQAETNASVYQLRSNPGGVDWRFGSSGTGEYFLAENRQQTGFDRGLDGCGLLIWHIDENRPGDNTANGDETHKLVDLEEADGQNHLDNMTNRGDTGDPYRGSSGNTTFNDGSNPNSRLYSGAVSESSVTDISAGCTNPMTADLTGPIVPTPTPTPIPTPPPTPPPGGGQTYRPYNDYTLSSLVPGDAVGTLATTFSIASPDYNYEDASMTTLLPVDGVTANGLEAPIGAKVGTLDQSLQIGLLGGTCSISVMPHFDLYNASVDIATPDYYTIDWILEPASVPIPDSDFDGLPDYLEQYPQFLNTMLDPDGAGPLLPLQPRARFAGHTSVANTHMLVQVLVFNPGQMAQLGGIYAQMGAEKGAPAYIVLNNPSGEMEVVPGAIGDFCTPLSFATTLYGVTQDNPATTANEAGYTRQSNPPANTGILGSGTHVAWNYSQSERNADGDAFENDFDACPYTADPSNWNPRANPCVPGSQPGDQDCDMLPVSCDPNDNVANPDVDGDGYSNTQDNCPFVANGCSNPLCGPIWVWTWDNQKDRDRGMSSSDLGPKTDAIGDACDDSDDDGNEDGAGGGCNDGIDNGGDTLIDGNDPNCMASMDMVDWPPAGAQPQNGVYSHANPWEAECVGGVDADGDGYCAYLEAALGSSDYNGPETGAQCANAFDDDGDGYVNDGCPYVSPYAETGALCFNATDDDGDGMPNDGCPVIGVPESLVIDANMTSAWALPATTAPQSCSDGIDNDNDGAIDTDGGWLACDPAAYAGDGDRDGIPDGSDNCPSVWNPTQTNTDGASTAQPPIYPAGDALGDACDTDDDADGYTDTIENYLPTDPLDRCTNVNNPGNYRSDTWGLDQDRNATITVVGDVLMYWGMIGRQVSSNPPTSWALSRLDLNGDRVITVAGDVLKYAGKIATTCT